MISHERAVQCRVEEMIHMGFYPQAGYVCVLSEEWTCDEHDQAQKVLIATMCNTVVCNLQYWKSQQESHKGGVKKPHVAPEPQVADPWFNLINTTE